MADSVLKQKSFDFAMRIVNAYKELTENKREFVLSKQMLRSGTSIGANIREAQRAQTTADFASKLTIALKEAEETLYWIELLKGSLYMDSQEADVLYGECEELVKMLVSSTKRLYEQGK